jgi:hypothetical protein
MPSEKEHASKMLRALRNVQLVMALANYRAAVSTGFLISC